MPPSISYYIVVAIVGAILLGIEIWEFILIEKSNKINDLLQTKLNQLHKETQKPYTNQQSGDEHSPESQEVHSDNNHVESDNSSESNL